MKIHIIALYGITFIWLCTVHISSGQQMDDDNDDFAEFEDFDGDDGFTGVTEKPLVKQQRDGKTGNNDGPTTKQPIDTKNADFKDVFDDGDDEDGLVEEEGEFEHFHDEEEFEGFTKVEQPALPKDEAGEPKLTMAKVPLHFR